MKRLLLLGGGHSHVEVLRQFGLRRAPGLEITLVSPSRYAAYSGMLPGLIAGHYDFGQAHIDLARLARFAGARFLITSSREVDAGQRKVVLADGATLGYDIASINIGSSSSTVTASDATDTVIAARPAGPLLRAWNALIARARVQAAEKIVVIGGGPAGVELLLAMQHRLCQLSGPGKTQFALVTGGDALLPGHNARVRIQFENVLAARGVEVMVNSPVARIESGAAIIGTGARIRADLFVWAAGAAPAPSLRLTGFAFDPAGFIAVNPYLQTHGQQDVFAAGDCASMRGHAYPKSGVHAVRQGPCLAGNLRRALTGKPLVTFRPQPLALALISSGNRHAIASYGPLALSGQWVWRWKDQLDRGFVRKYNTLPVDGA